MPARARPESPRLNRNNDLLGTTSPAIAAAIGNAAFRKEASSPTNVSRLISSPTSRKNSTIRPSLIQKCKGSESSLPAKPKVSFVPEVKVTVGPGRICPDERQDRAADQENSTGC